MAALPPITQLAGNHRALFDSYWSLVDKTNSGSIPAATAADFLKKSNLREPILHKIWELSDPTSTGCLGKQGFFMALRLVATCQLGKEPSVANIALTDPTPVFSGIDPAALDGRGSWVLTAEEQGRYEATFQTLKVHNGFLSGETARPFLLQSGLPLDVLGKVWSLSDIDKDGNLDKEEFSVAMKLISLAKSNEVLPPSLPASLIPASKVKKPVASIVPPTTTRGGSPLTLPPGSPVPGKKITANVDWVVPADAKVKFDGYFQGIDKDQDGYVNGEQARGLFMASNLPQPLLAHVWKMCDIEQTGRLNAEQFALAMFIIAEKVRGKEVPTELTPAMIPPSLRKQTTPSSSTPTHSTMPQSWTASFSSTPGVAMATSVADTSTAWSTPSNTGTDELNAVGFGSDFSAIKDLDTVSKEVDTIRKEKSQLADEIKTKQELILQRQNEVEALQSVVENTSQQRESLEKERLEAQSKLDDLDREKTRVDSEIAELRLKCVEEQKEIDRLREALSAQEVNKKSQSDELNKLRTQLEAFKKEEREYKDKVDNSAEELDKLQKAHQNIQLQISQTRQKIDSYKEEHAALSSTLTMYPASSTTPSSTRSSSVVNINDVGLSHLPSELTVPHVGETDAISARATAGSSSPVSSISGFSTNSHLDDGPEEMPKPEEKRAGADPFASTTQTANDPFAAFSIPPGDPFGVSGLGGAFKPSDVSAFDPFGGSSDPFKTTTTTSSAATPGEDLFKNDPFGTKAPAATGASADPFSGQDPFSSDPFSVGTSDKKESTQNSGWDATSGFGVDPFASQGSTSDPFSSGDPFGEDPFSRQAATPSDNPFASPTPSREEIKVPEALPKPGKHASNAERMRWAQRESEREEALRKKRQQEEEAAIAKAIRDSMKKT